MTTTHSYFFANREPIDLAAIELMGVSVKSGASPIGYFGTGLKFALATLARHGQKVTLRLGNRMISFQAFPETVRGQTFERMFMLEAGEAKGLGFTTQLGRNWQLWQAFRELESNCRDEQGVSRPRTGDGDWPADWGTVFEVTGEAFASVAAQKDKYFLASDARFADYSIEVHPLGPDPKAVYYRGVLAGQLPKPGLFTYNVLTGSLTEDRTLADLFWPAFHASTLVGRLAPKEDLERVLMASEDQWEQAWSSWPEVPTEAFGQVVRENRTSKALNSYARNTWLRYGDNRTTLWEPATPDGQMLRTAQKALELAKRLGAKLALGDFEIVSGLGPDVYGQVVGGKIYVSTRAFDMGPRFLASTLYEEWLHVHEGLGDETRSMQNWLFERLAATTEALMELEQNLGRPGEVVKVPTYEPGHPHRHNAERPSDDNS